jgi:hypothetical protein
VFHLSANQAQRLLLAFHPAARSAFSADVLLSIQNGNGMRLEPRRLATALVLQGAHDNLRFTHWAMVASLGVAALVSVVPVLLRTVLGLAPFGDTLPQALIAGLHLSLVHHMALLFLFISVGAADHMRRTMCLNHLAKLIGTGVSLSAPPPAAPLSTVGPASVAPEFDPGVGLAEVEVGDSVPLPILQLDSADSTRAFVETRHTLMAFGERFHRRLVAVCAAALALFTLIALVSFARMMMTRNTTEVLINFVLLHTLTFPAFTFVGFGLHTAALANAAAAAHASAIVRARLNSRHDEAGMKAVLDDVRMSVELQSAEHPVLIFGVVAGLPLTRAFVGLWASVETVAVSVLLSRLGYLS